PVGTLIIDKQTGKVMKDLTKHGESFIAAKGGKGGKGNVRFKSSVRQAPNFAEAGGAPQEREVILELKLIADIGLVGFPNVGKSTLLSVVTGARTKIDNYPFTTLTPNLGVVKYKDDSFIMADIPGLIEGAHTGSGLGLDFLKHIERTRLLIHIVDVSGSEGRDPIDDFNMINYELESYSSKLSKKPQIVAANKIDLASDEQYKRFEDYILSLGLRVFPISAPIHQGVSELIDETYKTLVSLPIEVEKYDYFDPSEMEDRDYKKIEYIKDNDVFVLSGKQLDKIFRSTNFNDMGSLRYLYKYIENSGVIDKLKDLGLKDGDTIRINDFEFEYIE
ncbi:MAG: Obg family GTPase CgtA, partial [Clostridiales bacterium]|nr:Obg family GTPase CgtA [Clostridiales bacterium]